MNDGANESKSFPDEGSVASCLCPDEDPENAFALFSEWADALDAAYGDL